MLMKVTLARGNLDFEAWLANRIKQDVKERYGIDIEVSSADSDSQQMIQQQTRPDPKKNEVISLDQLGNVLEPKHIQVLLGMSQRKTYEFLADAPFRVVRVGRAHKIPKSSFIEWFLGNPHD